MIELIKNTHIRFLRYKHIAITCSIVLIIAGIIYVIVRGGLNFSIDFKGGTLIQVKFEKPIRNDIGKIRSIITKLGYGSPEVKTVGPVENNEIQITIPKQKEGILVSEQIREALKKSYDNPFEFRRIENVGPKIGGELKRNALIASLLSLLAILIYVGFRFNLPFGVAAVVPLFHDSLITVALFSMFGLGISLTFIAALLTIIGYSLNDTIVIFDRIRENIKAGLRGKNLEQMIDESLNQTLSRTLLTSLTTLMAIVPLFVIGSEAIKDFSLALIIGIIVGTYSSIYIASPILVWWNKKWPFIK
ncbi:MAG: protein translocase subunit SecF [Chitinispirillaceae bacterium]|nr:protein translocase subunit SecF [Chitinispirillaceae bacterium]